MSKQSTNCKKVCRAELFQRFDFYSARFKRLHKRWRPIQLLSPILALVLCSVGVCISLAARSSGHWLFFAPAICLSIMTEIVIEEVQTSLLQVTDEHRDLLSAAPPVVQAAGNGSR